MSHNSRVLIRWRRHLRRAIRIERRIETLPPSRAELLRSPLKLVTLLMLVQTRRLAEAIDRLVPEHSWEAQILQRSMLETWVNGEWIRLREPSRRAHRFITFECVEGVQLLEQCPPYARPSNASDQLAELKRWRSRYGRMFNEGDGKWAGTWAVSKSKGGAKTVHQLKLRLEEVERAFRDSDDPMTGTPYWGFRVLSKPAHGSPVGLTRLFDWSSRGHEVKTQPNEQPLEPIIEAARYLIVHLMWAHLDKLSTVFEGEIKSVMEEHKRLPP